MKCHECGKHNMKKANYCKKCGYKFTEEEKKHKNNSIVVTILTWVKRFYEAITLKIFTDSKIVQALYVLGVFAIGIYMVLTMGNSLRILESDIYDVKYNQKTEEYYIFLDQDQNESKVDVQLYVPNRVEKLHLAYYHEDGSMIEEETYKKEDKITLSVNKTENNYYMLSDPK